MFPDESSVNGSYSSSVAFGDVSMFLSRSMLNIALGRSSIQSGEEGGQPPSEIRDRYMFLGNVFAGLAGVE